MKYSKKEFVYPTETDYDWIATFHDKDMLTISVGEAPFQGSMTGFYGIIVEGTETSRPLNYTITMEWMNQKVYEIAVNKIVEISLKKDDLIYFDILTNNTNF